MLRAMNRLGVFATALWWGSLTTLGLLVVPLLFARLPTAATAGNMAAQLFSAQTWVSVACGLALLLVLQQKTGGAQVQSSSLAMILVVSGMLLALLVAFGVAPRIVARENLKLWHGVGSAMYLAQWLCAGGLLWLLPVSLPSQVVSAVDDERRTAPRNTPSD